MRVLRFVLAPAVASALALLSLSNAPAQEGGPGSQPEQMAPPVTGPARLRPPVGVAPLNRANPNRPEQAGRNALYKYLDDIAARQTADRRDAVAKIVTRAEAEARQREVRRKVLALIGGLPAKTPLNAKVLGSTQLDGFRIEKILYESQPKFFVTALLYLPGNKTPDSPSQKLPAIVMAPGHAASGKAGDFALASTFARNGFAVLSYDPIGQGERLQYPDPATVAKGLTAGSLASRPTGEHGEAGLQPTLIGDAVARYFAWDGMRAVDYLISRSEVDPARIGAFGCSGGGAMTALLGALDPRVHATATACYFTSFDALLPSIGAQDAEQSIPGFIASGLDFPDWAELAAPRPYAFVGTVSDMFPWAGFLSTARETRRFYSLFDPSAAGTEVNRDKLAVGQAQQASAVATPTGPTLNPDTPNNVPATAPFQVIAGIGGHGNLGPITSQIVSFFLVNLAHSTAAPIVPPAPARGASPFAAPKVPAGTLQVTATGQVATSYPGCATVFSLNLARAAEKLPKNPRHLKSGQLQAAIREVTHATVQPGPQNMVVKFAGSELPSPDSTGSSYNVLHLSLPTEPGITIAATLAMHPESARRYAVLLLSETPPLPPGEDPETGPNSFEALAGAGNVVLSVTPRPSPPGDEEIKSPILGPFYMTELRAELVGKSILGMRVDDVIRAVDYLAARPDVDPSHITAIARGHMGLVLLHAAMLDPRLRHITVVHSLESYRSLLAAPMPLDAPQDILPGVLLHYDIPDLARALGPRLTLTDPLPGTADLAAN